jgi:hypothetical protein
MGGVVVSLKDWIDSRSGEAAGSPIDHQAWLEVVVQLLPAPPGVRAVIAVKKKYDDASLVHSPLVAIGLQRDGEIVPVPAPGIQSGWCVDGVYVDDAMAPRACPVCAREATKTRAVAAAPRKKRARATRGS